MKENHFCCYLKDTFISGKYILGFFTPIAIELKVF